MRLRPVPARSAVQCPRSSCVQDRKAVFVAASTVRCHSEYSGSREIFTDVQFLFRDLYCNVVSARDLGKFLHQFINFHRFPPPFLPCFPFCPSDSFLSILFRYNLPCLIQCVIVICCYYISVLHRVSSLLYS